MLYAIVMGTVKISILFQYLRIFCVPGQRDYMFWSCWICIVCIACFYVAGFFACLAICDPIHKYWTPWMTEGTCLNRSVILIGSGVVNVLGDIGIILLPQGRIWTLQMSRRSKLHASAIFLIALM
jgi:hypothetical protein